MWLPYPKALYGPGDNLTAGINLTRVVDRQAVAVTAVAVERPGRPERMVWAVGQQYPTGLSVATPGTVLGVTTDILFVADIGLLLLPGESGNLRLDWVVSDAASTRRSKFQLQSQWRGSAHVTIRMIASPNVSLLTVPSNVSMSPDVSGVADSFQERFDILLWLIIGGCVFCCLLLTVAVALLLWCQLRSRSAVLPFDASGHVTKGNGPIFIHGVDAVQGYPFKQMSRSSSPQTDDLSPASSASSPGRRFTCAPLLGHESSSTCIEHQNPLPMGLGAVEEC